MLPDARAAPNFPAAAAIRIFAIAVPPTPSASRESKGPNSHLAASNSGNPSGAVKISPTS